MRFLLVLRTIETLLNVFVLQFVEADVGLQKFIALLVEVLHVKRGDIQEQEENIFPLRFDVEHQKDELDHCEQGDEYRNGQKDQQVKLRVVEKVRDALVEVLRNVDYGQVDDVEVVLDDSLCVGVK